MSQLFSSLYNPYCLKSLVVLCGVRNFCEELTWNSQGRIHKERPTYSGVYEIQASIVISTGILFFNFDIQGRHPFLTGQIDLKKSNSTSNLTWSFWQNNIGRKYVISQ